MHRRDAASSVSALVLVLAIVLIGVSVGACGASGNPSATVGCRVGADVGSPQHGHALPACTATEPRGSAYNYPCRAPASGAPQQDFYLVYLPEVVLYGKPSGVWHRAPASAHFAVLRGRLHC